VLVLGIVSLVFLFVGLGFGVLVWNFYFEKVSRNPTSRHLNQEPETESAMETIRTTNMTINVITKCKEETNNNNT
jgi:hypothetical protein